MTCREKLKLEYPDSMRPDDIPYGCPSDYGYLPDPLDKFHQNACEITNCCDCWNRELPEEKVPKIQTDSVYGSMIKDSGDRTEFASGAVRDMREGKGRCDLMPLEVISKMINYVDGDCVINSILGFVNTNRTEFLYDALNTFTAAYHNQVETLILEAAKHFEEGAKKYGESNWKRGIPTWCYIDSAVRHYLKWLRGDKDEPHDRAFVWNLMCCIWEVDYRSTCDTQEDSDD